MKMYIVMAIVCCVLGVINIYTYNYMLSHGTATPAEIETTYNLIRVCIFGTLMWIAFAFVSWVYKKLK